MENKPAVEKPNEFWNRVYAAVVITTVVVVTALWAFSKYFSS
jgi:ABC-type glycerol-3-phosphate transport system permease component